jgi:hypothetical protein
MKIIVTKVKPYHINFVKYIYIYIIFFTVYSIFLLKYKDGLLGLEWKRMNVGLNMVVCIGFFGPKI